MIAVRLLSKQEVAKLLHAHKCERVPEGDLPEQSYWRTADGFHFYLPELGPDKRTPETVVHEVLADVTRAVRDGKSKK